MLVVFILLGYGLEVRARAGADVPVHLNSPMANEVTRLCHEHRLSEAECTAMCTGTHIVTANSIAHFSSDIDLRALLAGPARPVLERRPLSAARAARAVPLASHSSHPEPRR